MQAIHECPVCNIRIKLPEKLTGKNLRCPKCRAVFKPPGDGLHPRPQQLAHSPSVFASAAHADCEPHTPEGAVGTGSTTAPSRVIRKMPLLVLPLASVVVLGVVGAAIYTLHGSSTPARQVADAGKPGSDEVHQKTNATRDAEVQANATTKPTEPGRATGAKAQQSSGKPSGEGNKDSTTPAKRKTKPSEKEKVRAQEEATVDRLIADAKGFKEPEQRDGSGLTMHTLARAIDVLIATGYPTNCYTTHLDEAQLLHKYGKPDEVTKSVEIPDAAMRKTKCRGLRYDWLLIYVTDKGEIFAVDRQSTDSAKESERPKAAPQDNTKRLSIIQKDGLPIARYTLPQELRGKDDVTLFFFVAPAEAPGLRSLKKGDAGSGWTLHLGEKDEPQCYHVMFTLDTSKQQCGFLFAKTGKFERYVEMPLISPPGCHAPEWGQFGRRVRIEATLGHLGVAMAGNVLEPLKATDQIDTIEIENPFPDRARKEEIPKQAPRDPEKKDPPKRLAVEYAAFGTPIVRYTPDLKGVALQKGEKFELFVFLTSSDGPALNKDIARAGGEGVIMHQPTTGTQVGYSKVVGPGISGYRWEVDNYLEESVAHNRTLTVALEGSGDGLYGMPVDWSIIGKEARVSAAVATFKVIGGDFVFQRFVTPVAAEVFTSTASGAATPKELGPRREENTGPKEIQGLDKILADLPTLKEPKKGGNSSIGDAIEKLVETKRSTMTLSSYSTMLNEQELVRRYGPPDEVTYEKWIGKKKLKTLRYRWLKILVAENGSIRAVRRTATLSKPNGREVAGGKKG